MRLPSLSMAAICALALAGAAAAASTGRMHVGAARPRVALALTWPPPASPFQAADEILESIQLVVALAGGKLDADDDWPRVVASVATGCAVSLGAVAATGGVEPLAASQARALTAFAVSRALSTVGRGARHLIA